MWWSLRRSSKRNLQLSCNGVRRSTWSYEPGFLCSGGRPVHVYGAGPLKAATSLQEQCRVMFYVAFGAIRKDQLFNRRSTMGSGALKRSTHPH